MNTPIKVSIVEDHPIYRNGVKGVIEECPQLIFFSEANNGQEFIPSLKYGIPDVVLLDIEMPVMGGEETAKYLAKHYPQIKIIILTMHKEVELARHLMKRGIRGYLEKGIDVAPLTEAILSVMTIGYYFNDYITQDIIEDLLSGKNITPVFNTVTLSYREQQVVSLMCNEYISKQIAEILNLDTRTVDFHKSQIIKKIGVINGLGVIVYGIENGLKTKFGYKRNTKNHLNN